jgi:hypothetical protein
VHLGARYLWHFEGGWAAREESEAKDAQRDISRQGLERGHGSVVETGCEELCEE